MNPHDFFGKLSDDELAEWHMLKNEVVQLKIQLAACEQARKEELERGRIATEAAQRLYEEYATEATKLIGERNAADEQSRRDRNRMLVLARCLPGIITFFIDTYSCFDDLALTPDVQAMRRDAREVLTLLEPFAE